MKDSEDKMPMDAGNQPDTPAGAPTEPSKGGEKDKQAPSPHSPVEPEKNRGSRLMLWIVVAIIAFGLLAVGVYHRRHKNAAPSTNTGVASQTSGTTPANATDNASLQQDLNSINSDISKGNSDQTSVDNALNDQQIQVPTN